MYEAIRKYYKTKTGAPLTLKDVEIYSVLRWLSKPTADDIVASLKDVRQGPVPRFTAFKYDKSLFDGVLDAKSYVDCALILTQSLPTIVYSVASDEGTTWTFHDIEAYLLDGIVTGMQSRAELSIVDGVDKAYRVLPEISSGYVTLEDSCRVHAIAMSDLIRDKSQLGCIRTRDVRIGSVETWQSFPIYELKDAFEKEAAYVNDIENVIERAVIAMLWLQYRQFFLDGNKRVSRCVCNSILYKYNMGVFSVPKDRVAEYRQLLADFYTTADPTRIIAYTLEHCLTYFPNDDETKWAR